MILDSTLQFSDAQATFTTDVVSTNIIDLLNARDMGVGDSPAVQVIGSISTAFASTNSATLAVQFQGSTDSTTWTTYVQTPAVTASFLTTNSRLFPIDVPLVPQGVTLPRYYRLNYLVGTGTFTAGKISAWLGVGRSDLIVYPSNYTNGYPAT